MNKQSSVFKAQFFLGLKYVSILLVLIAQCSFATVAATTPSQPVMVTSPDGNVQLLLEAKNGRLTYTVTFNKASVIEPSALCIVVNGKKYGADALFGKVTRYSLNDIYPINGVHSMAVNHCNGALINILSPQAVFAIEAKVFDNGVAFRYVVDSKGESVVNQDSTAFNLKPGTIVWSQPNIKYYEGKYGKKSIADFKPGELAGPPATLELPDNGGYAAITEGGLVDFAGMSLKANGNNGFVANLTGVAKQNGKIETPWRVIEVGKDLNDLVNCDIITNVSPAPDAKLFPQGNSTTWVKPGRSVWSWLAKTRAVTLDNMKHFSDLAAQLGFEYNLVDEGWGTWSDGTHDQYDMLKELVDYSAKKGVKIWVWKAYPDRKGIAGINTPEKRKAFFKKCKEIGVTGLKVDFFDSESQEIVDFYQAALKDAAEYHLMMDFHGANKPTGENRTWPNELTREAIRGMENSPPWAPGNTTLPFTRYLAGPADFTPVHFGTRIGEVTWAQHIASMIVFTSPLMCLGADPESILDNPCKAIIQSIPPTWDETIVLPPSKIGELALYARRKGDTWYIAAMSGVNEAKTIDINLSFLKKGNYMVSSVNDDPKTQAGAALLSEKLPTNMALHIVMNGFGGYVGKITKAK